MLGNVSLTPKQEKLIAALLAPNTIVVAAKIAGISEQTAYRWFKDRDFQQAYKAAQQQVFDQALSELMQKVEKAIDTLDRHMDADETPAHTQVRSAQIILEQAIEVHRSAEIERRLAALEEREGIG